MPYIFVIGRFFVFVNDYNIATEFATLLNSLSYFHWSFWGGGGGYSTLAKIRKKVCRKGELSGDEMSGSPALCACFRALKYSVTNAKVLGVHVILISADARKSHQRA